jgi:hypothetical protein
MGEIESWIDLVVDDAPLEDVVEFLRDREDDEVIIRRLARLLEIHKDELFEEWDWLRDTCALHGV